MLDILTFYQERLANESYLRTATQLRSLIELSRLIGYQPAPGVAALTYLAFTLKAATGQPPNPSTPAITIPQGTQVQSVPAQGQTAQTFRDLGRYSGQAGLECAASAVGESVDAAGRSRASISRARPRNSIRATALLILGLSARSWTPSARRTSSGMSWFSIRCRRHAEQHYLCCVGPSG